MLDLSVGSLDIDSLDTVQDAARFSTATFERIAANKTNVGIGRYDEPRLVYVTELFRHQHNWAEENRTVHLGIDLFQEAETPVFAPMAGRVHSFAQQRGARGLRPDDHPRARDG